MDTQPGQVITPQEENAQTSSPSQTSATTTEGLGTSNQPAAPTPSPSSDVPLPQSGSQVSGAASSVPQQGLWRPEGSENTDTADTSLPEDIQWTAAEFIEHPKTASWYALLVLAGVVLATVDYLLTKDIISTIFIAIAAAMFGFYAGRKPQTREYRLGPQGVYIGHKTYEFQNYKHFSVIDEGSMSSIVFMPMKRFEVPLTIYVSSEIEEKVLDYLSTFLPFERHQIDAVDGLLRRIRF